MKPKILYHGSSKKLIKNKLIPNKAGGLGRKEDKQKAVYATDIKLGAILRGILSDKNVISSSISNKTGKLGTIVYRGWPKIKKIYLHYLSSKDFENLPIGSSQYLSKKSVKPIKTKEIDVKEYIHLIKKAPEKEAKEWYKKYRLEWKKTYEVLKNNHNNL